MDRDGQQHQFDAWSGSGVDVGCWPALGRGHTVGIVDAELSFLHLSNVPSCGLRLPHASAFTASGSDYFQWGAACFANGLVGVIGC